ncbi:MAG: hypothetical protein GY904_26625 [Planctomycetaceae bacterium]|nr:hypothetical protein [Planctomycetaceae bacterium]
MHISLTLQFIALGLVLIAFVTLVGFLAVTWPQLFFPALGLFWLACTVLDIRTKYRTISTLGEQYDRIENGEPATFVGLYRPHWEIGHIQIALTKRWLGFVPAFESWSPCFVAEFPVEFDILDNDSNFLIKFVGTPTERGQFGHMGSMCREIRITEFLDVQPLPKKAA